MVTDKYLTIRRERYFFQPFETYRSLFTTIRTEQRFASRRKLHAIVFGLFA